MRESKSVASEYRSKQYDERYNCICQLVAFCGLPHVLAPRIHETLRKVITVDIFEGSSRASLMEVPAMIPVITAPRSARCKILLGEHVPQKTLKLHTWKCD